MNQPAGFSRGYATLYYDGQCPLCTKEMARLAKHKDHQLQLADIHTLAPDPRLPDTDTLLRNLHLRMPDGRLLTGADANVAAWQYTRHGAWFRWMRWPVISRFVDRLYDAWARRRYTRLYNRSCNPQKSSDSETTDTPVIYLPGQPDNHGQRTH